MNVRKCIRAGVVAIAIAVAAPVFAWDFDQTRAADIVDRAVNDGDETALLLLALALDDRVETIYDDYPFRFPAVADKDHLYIKDFRPQRIYESLMGGMSNISNESIMVYAIQGAFALNDRRYARALNYYQIARNISNELGQQEVHPAFGPVMQDTGAGVLAAAVCNRDPRILNSIPKIKRALEGFAVSGVAEDYLAQVTRANPKMPGAFSRKEAKCWNRPLRRATVVLPKAPYNYEINYRKTSGVLQQDM